MPHSSFRALGVPEVLDNVLAASGKTEPFPIQSSSLPESLAGRDVLGRGRTGSGKTIAFALPLIANIAARANKRTPGRPRGLVLAPTRELATQIAATVEPLAAATGLNVMTIFGGVSQRPQEDKLRRGIDIVVACPGRLEDLMRQGHIKLDAVEVAVLDEADHMADLGFLPGVTRILAATPHDGQRLLFSATLDRGVDKLVSRFLPNPVRCEVDEASVPSGEMTHRVLVPTDADDKNRIVKDLASGTGRRILFTRTKHHAKKLARTLTAAGIPAVELQGNLSQNARERNLALFGAKPEDGGVRVLVATDVAARGVHVDDVELVVHVDPPEDHKAYLHRSGRTARAGASGTVATIVLASQKNDAAGLLRAAQIRAPFENVTSGDETIEGLVGERAAYRAPDAEALQAAKRGGRGTKPAGNRQRNDGGSRSGGHARPARDGARDGARPARDGARDGARPARDGARPARDSARDGARPARDGARDGARATRDTVEHGGRQRSHGAGRTGAPRSGAAHGGAAPRGAGATANRNRNRVRSTER